ncbi:MAG: hypothetical protein AVDCRST_MAG20-1704, partial [uncultured Acidimicrobiales bacterium]
AARDRGGGGPGSPPERSALRARPAGRRSGGARRPGRLRHRGRPAGGGGERCRCVPPARDAPRRGTGLHPALRPHPPRRGPPHRRVPAPPPGRDRRLRPRRHRRGRRPAARPLPAGDVHGGGRGAARAAGGGPGGRARGRRHRCLLPHAVPERRRPHARDALRPARGDVAAPRPPGGGRTERGSLPGGGGGRRAGRPHPCRGAAAGTPALRPPRPAAARPADPAEAPARLRRCGGRGPGRGAVDDAERGPLRRRARPRLEQPGLGPGRCQLRQDVVDEPDRPLAVRVLRRLRPDGSGRGRGCCGAASPWPRVRGGPPRPAAGRGGGARGPHVGRVRHRAAGAGGVLRGAVLAVADDRHPDLVGAGAAGRRRAGGRAPSPPPGVAARLHLRARGHHDRRHLRQPAVQGGGRTGGRGPGGRGPRPAQRRRATRWAEFAALV